MAGFTAAFGSRARTSGRFQAGSSSKIASGSQAALALTRSTDKWHRARGDARLLQRLDAVDQVRAIRAVGNGEAIVTNRSEAMIKARDAGLG